MSHEKPVNAEETTWLIGGGKIKVRGLDSPSVTLGSGGSGGLTGLGATLDWVTGHGGASSAAERVIVCAALKYDDLIIPCVSHWDSYAHRILVLLGDKKPQVAPTDIVEGFIDNFGDFHGRKEAWVIAEAAGQIRRRIHGDESNSLKTINLY